MFAVSDTTPFQASSTFTLFFNIWTKGQNPPFSFSFFGLITDALYCLQGLKLFPCLEPGVELNIIKGNILQLTSGCVSCGNAIFCILGFATYRYFRCYLMATIWLYTHRDETPYTLRILPGYNGHPNRLEDIE